MQSDQPETTGMTRDRGYYAQWARNAVAFSLIAAIAGGIIIGVIFLMINVLPVWITATSFVVLLIAPATMPENFRLRRKRHE